MAEKFPTGSTITLNQISPDERITLADFGGSQDEMELKYKQAISYQNLHKKKALREPTYDASDPAGVNSGIPVTADELREAEIERGTIPIPETDDETFRGLHLVIQQFTLPDDETNEYYATIINLSRDFVRGT